METKVKAACLFAGIVDHWHEGIIYPDEPTPDVLRALGKEGKEETVAN